MPTVAEIERLTALMQRLVPLSSRARGEVIAAQDWNIVVGALIEVARATVESGAGDEVPVHDHAESVRMAWLEPGLRARVERGSLDDPAATGRVTALERALAKLDDRLGAAADDLRQVRATIARVETNDLDRERHITSVIRKVDGLGDARADVSAVRETLGSLRGDLDRVTAFAAGLEHAGQPVDVGALLTRLEAVEELRTRLTTPGGDLLDATEITRRQSELETKLVTEDELTAAIAASNKELPDDVRAGVLDGARAVAREEATAVASAASQPLLDRMQVRLAEVEAAALRAATERTDDLGNALRASLHAELEAVIAAGDDAVRGEARALVTQSAAATRREVDERAGRTRAEIEDAIAQRMDVQRAELTELLTARVDAIRDRIPALEKGTKALAEADTKAATELARVTSTLEAKIVTTNAATQAEFDTRLRTLAETQGRTRDELASTLKAELAAERLSMSSALDALRDQIPGLVDDRVGRAQDDLSILVNDRIDKLRPELTRFVESRVTDEIRRHRPPG